MPLVRQKPKPTTRKGTYQKQSIPGAVARVREKYGVGKGYTCQCGTYIGYQQPERCVICGRPVPKEMHP